MAQGRTAVHKQVLISDSYADNYDDDYDTPARDTPDTLSLRRATVTRVFAWLLVLIVPLVGLFYSLSLAAGSVSSDALRRSPIGAGALGLTTLPPPSVTAKAAFVFDPNQNAIFYTKSADVELPMASCTKIMTALLAVEHGSLDQLVTIGSDAAALAGPGNSHMGLSAGEKVSLHDLLYGLMLPSGNDAAVAIADDIGGNVTNFVAMMNARAQQLGLTHTHFANPHGLDADGHYTTARELAILASVAMKNPILVTITSTKHYSIAKTSTHKAYDLETGDDLIAGARSPYPGSIGVKPGFTGNAGYCQAFAAIRHGHLIVGVVLGEPSWEIRITDMRTLLNWGFEQEGISAAPAPIPWSYPTPEP
ncbi:MAG: D-alanyl-D-alanine carboxypeptidase [Ktedonobacterales bacterium]|jgi:D-alanyl-D-alanine carboxypeptidase|nr:MAG: D-alanyl-D-alanine carboxypeptidase [Ktedonobacterales bacterium]